MGSHRSIVSRKKSDRQHLDAFSDPERSEQASTNDDVKHDRQPGKERATADPAQCRRQLDPAPQDHRRIPESLGLLLIGALKERRRVLAKFNPLCWDF